MELSDAVSIAPALDSTIIAAGVFGALSVGSLIFFVMQIIKGFWPTLDGRRAELMVLCVSLFVATVVLVASDADWLEPSTYVSLVVGTVSLNVIARGVYAQLFKVGVVGSPPSSEAEAVVISDSAVTTEPVVVASVPQVTESSPFSVGRIP